MSSKHAILAAALSLVVCAALVSCKPKPPQGPPQMPPPEVTVMTVVPSSVTVTEEYVGQTDAKDTVEIRSRVGGLLASQNFEDGAHVKAGQSLYVIDQEPYRVALAQAKASVSQAKASVSQAKADHLKARQDLGRAVPLSEANAISKKDLDAAVAVEQTAAARVEAGEATIKQAEAAVAQAELNLGYTTVTAPSDGDLGASLVRRGALISAASTLMTTLYSVDPMYINTTVSESRLLALTRKYGSGLGKGMAAGPAIKVLMSDGVEYPYPAHINYIGAAVDKTSGTLQVRVSVPNSKRELRPGQFVRLVFPETTIKDAITVPLRAVRDMQEVKTVLVVGPENIVEARQIRGDKRVGNELVVEDGLKPGETIIVEGTAKARPGAPVNPVVPGEAAAAGVPGDKAPAPASQDKSASGRKKGE